MRLKRTRRGKTFVDIAVVYGKVRITMGNPDSGNKNTDLDAYELDQLITMLSYYKLEIEGKLADAVQDESGKFQLVVPNPHIITLGQFEKVCPPDTWVRATCQGNCDWTKDHRHGEQLDLFGKAQNGNWYHWRKGDVYGEWAESIDPFTIPDATVKKYI